MNLLDWFKSLEPSFVFLLAMPVAVACAGLARHWFDEYRSRGRAQRDPN
jgi:hypothetical protein